MDTRDFCFWLQGLMGATYLSVQQQEEVKKRLDEVLKEEKSTCKISFESAPHPIHPFPVDPVKFRNTCSEVGQNACRE